MWEWGQRGLIGGIVMAKTYTLQGPIMLENLTNAEALSFIAAVVAEIPAHSMGSASMNLDAQGPAGPPPQKVSGRSVDELKASLGKAQAQPLAAEDIVYHVRGSVNLFGLSLAEGIDMIDTTMRAIPNEDALVMTSMLAVEENPV